MSLTPTGITPIAGTDEVCSQHRVSVIQSGSYSIKYDYTIVGSECVQAGDLVTRGHVLGIMGSTGCSTSRIPASGFSSPRIGKIQRHTSHFVPLGPTVVDIPWSLCGATVVAGKEE